MWVALIVAAVIGLVIIVSVMGRKNTEVSRPSMEDAAYAAGLRARMREIEMRRRGN